MYDNGNTGNGTYLQGKKIKEKKLIIWYNVWYWLVKLIGDDLFTCLQVTINIFKTNRKKSCVSIRKRLNLAKWRPKHSAIDSLYELYPHIQIRKTGPRKSCWWKLNSSPLEFVSFIWQLGEWLRLNYTDAIMSATYWLDLFPFHSRLPNFKEVKQTSDSNHIWNGIPSRDNNNNN